MKINKLHKSIVVLFCIINSSLFSQDNGVYIDNTMISIPNTGESSSGSLNFITPCSDFYIKDGKAWIKIDLGENYEFGYDNFGIPFEISATIDLRVLTEDATVDPTISFPVVLSNNKPESLIYVDLNKYIDKENSSTGFSYLGNSILGIEGIVSDIQNSATTINSSANIRISLNYEIAYGISVTSNEITNLSYSLIPGTKVIVFNWEDSCNASGYEFQILRLFNTDPALVNDERIITTTIDWSKALSLAVENSTTSIDLSIGEGQGYYTWRVRPIGTYYDNGIGNDQNWGNWNTIDYPACTNCLFDISFSSNQVFFFEDPDDDKNYQYSRVFTEGSKISEQVTYATSLNQVKQTQRYIPSKDYKVITQTILDNSGRPTLNTLPIPIKGEKINKYKEGFVKAAESLYKAENFDDDDNDDKLDTYNKPSMIDATGAFEYYSSANVDKRIPDAEGYPFTRVLYSNDGTDRVVEQSGVGKTHMIGQTVDGKTRTTRTLYATPTEDELVKLFGDEAPNHEDIAKIITIDPNGTRSVSYITKEGNTIATGLTFSEDENVLDSVKDENLNTSVSGVMDKISNNIKTSEGFMASKRITILQDATEINISYAIKEQILEGLCNNLELDLDYRLTIEVFDIKTGSVVQSFEEETIKDYTDSTDDGIDNVTVDFGKITLDAGTYYIQKTLVPSENIKLETVTAEESINKLIKPFFNWLVTFSDKIDCEEEMEYLYHDVFHFGKLVFDEQLAANISNGLDGAEVATVNFDCQGCSGESITFKGKTDPSDDELDDEFLDYYKENKDKYNITVFYFNETGKLQPFNYVNTNELGNKRPVKVQFTTPCCNFEIPIVFTPPFRVPDPEAVTLYKNDPVLHAQPLTSISYYNEEDTKNPLTGVNTQNPINPNPNFLLGVDDNFTYEKIDEETFSLNNTDAYPMDFEGYAISMLYECKTSSDPNYSREKAAEAIYSYMRGWHRPGLLNQMVYHMATDNYQDQNCADEDKTSGPVFSRGTGYEACDVPKADKKLEGAQYSIQELADCWEPIVIDIVNRICVSGFELNENAEDNVADSYDERGGVSNKHLKDNIKNFIIRWISKPKLIRKIRKQKVSGEGDGAAQNQAMDEINNAVNTFLKCTGYAFADIVDANKTEPKANFPIFQDDFNSYDRNRLAYPSIADSDDNIDWVYFTIDPTKDGNGDDLIDGDYLPPNQDEIDADVLESQLQGRIAEFFPFVKDPVFAFKYFEYLDGAFPVLEGETCYRDPNICIDEITGEEFPCCGEYANGDPIPCNFCDVGYVTCEETKQDWDCDQRYTYYELIKNYREEVVPDVAPITCDNYYEATKYVINPDYDKDSDNPADYNLNFEGDIPVGALSNLEYLSDKMFKDQDPSGFIITPFAEMAPIPQDRWFKNLKGEPQSEGVSISENEAFELINSCSTNCEDRKNEFKTVLIQSFEDRCYVIADCKIETNDNIVPEADIDALVELIIAQCKKQCEIDTYACVDETCRLLGSPTRIDRSNPAALASYTINISLTDFGVSGPIAERDDIPNNRKDQFLKYFDPITGITSETGLAPQVDEIGTTGFMKYSYDKSQYPSVTIWDMRQSLTYAQSTRVKQAEEWDVNLDVPSKCDSTGNYNSNLTYNSDNLPNEPVYVYNTDSNSWEQQLFGICTNQEEYISRENPEGQGDTFVERNTYIKNNRKPYSPNDPDYKEPIESPKTGINKVITPN